MGKFWNSLSSPDQNLLTTALKRALLENTTSNWGFRDKRETKLEGPSSTGAYEFRLSLVGQGTPVSIWGRESCMLQCDFSDYLLQHRNHRMEQKARRQAMAQQVNWEKNPEKQQSWWNLSHYWNRKWEHFWGSHNPANHADPPTWWKWSGWGWGGPPGHNLTSIKPQNEPSRMDAWCARKP